MLNENALLLYQFAEQHQKQLKISLTQSPVGCRIFDCGIHCPGSQGAGHTASAHLLVRHGNHRIPPRGEPGLSSKCRPITRSPRAWPPNMLAGRLKVMTTSPWVLDPCVPLRRGNRCLRRSAIKSGPADCLGVLESSKLPPEEVCEDIAAKCGIAPEKLTLFVAPYQ